MKIRQKIITADINNWRAAQKNEESKKRMDDEIQKKLDEELEKNPLKIKKDVIADAI
jgi:hypothetical protein